MRHLLDHPITQAVSRSGDSGTPVAAVLILLLILLLVAILRSCSCSSS